MVSRFMQIVGSPLRRGYACKVLFFCLCVLVAMQRKALKGLFGGIGTEVLAASTATSRFDEVN